MPYKNYEDTKANVIMNYHKKKAEDPTFMPRMRAKTKETRFLQKIKVFAHYGFKCTHCGIDDPRVLDIDHKHNNGHEESRGNRSHLQQGLCSGKRKWEDYQLLCTNCNRIKYYKWKESQGFELSPLLKASKAEELKQWIDSLAEGQ